MPDITIYNCHVHIFTNKSAPPYILKLKLGLLLGVLLSSFTRYKWFLKIITTLLNILKSGDNDILERLSRFVQTGEVPSQEDIFNRLQKQYPPDTVFVALPMDMKFADMGEPLESIENQHSELLELASRSNGRLIPFYAADPRRDNIVEEVRKNLAPDKFRGIKIYPNLGYHPADLTLMEVYSICEKGGYPVMTHCSPSGVWQYGLTREDRINFSKPANYIDVLNAYPRLKVCLAHFGGKEEWERQLKGREDNPERETWVKTIYDMIASGDYPNLYTDISYTVFMPKLSGMYIDLIDYLKVLLSNERIRSRVLFGSDFYMNEQEELSEKEVSIMLRSRLGEDLFFQIANTNPKQYLGITS